MVVLWLMMERALSVDGGESANQISDGALCLDDKEILRIQQAMYPTCLPCFPKGDGRPAVTDESTQATQPPSGPYVFCSTPPRFMQEFELHPRHASGNADDVQPPSLAVLGLRRGAASGPTGVGYPNGTGQDAGKAREACEGGEGESQAEQGQGAGTVGASFFARGGGRVGSRRRWADVALPCSSLLCMMTTKGWVPQERRAPGFMSWFKRHRCVGYVVHPRYCSSRRLPGRRRKQKEGRRSLLLQQRSNDVVKRILQWGRFHTARPLRFISCRDFVARRTTALIPV